MDTKIRLYLKSARLARLATLPVLLLSISDRIRFEYEY